MPAFHVDLDFYHGPLDLLVVLVRQQEIDILELMIGEITRRYIDGCELQGSIDIEEVGDFLILASSLMETKSRHLLPRVEESELEIEADETKQELVKQLLEYRRFREAATMLGERALEQQRRLARQASDLALSKLDPTKQPIRELELWDLVSAFSRLMRENIVPVTDTVEKDPTPLPVYMNRLEELILAAGTNGITFRDLLGTQNAKPQIIGKFLATLELIKGRRVWVEYDPATEEIIFFPPRDVPLMYGDDSDNMAMADNNAPPAGMLGEEPTSDQVAFEDEGFEGEGELLERFNQSFNDEITVEPNPDSAWAGFEPLDDEFDTPESDELDNE